MFACIDFLIPSVKRGGSTLYHVFLSFVFPKAKTPVNSSSFRAPFCCAISSPGATVESITWGSFLKIPVKAPSQADGTQISGRWPERGYFLKSSLSAF